MGDSMVNKIFGFMGFPLIDAGTRGGKGKKVHNRFDIPLNYLNRGGPSSTPSPPAIGYGKFVASQGLNRGMYDEAVQGGYSGTYDSWLDSQGAGRDEWAGSGPGGPPAIIPSQGVNYSAPMMNTVGTMLNGGAMDDLLNQMRQQAAQGYNASMLGGQQMPSGQMYQPDWLKSLL
jgi:hypothetical protein